MSDRLVKIVSYVNLPEAELAQVRLAFDGIPARLGNATLVLWFWWYSNAVGGVTLHVLGSDAERAREILLPTRARATDERPPWTCPACGQHVDGSWEICWNCSSPADGSPKLPSDQQDMATIPAQRAMAADGSDLISLAVLLIALILVATGNLFAFAVAWAIFAVTVAWYRAVRGADVQSAAPDKGRDEEPEPPLDPARESREGRRRMGEAIALRAWRASLFGFVCFPPLLLYSTWLLWRLDPRKTPVGRLGNYRRLAAWIVSVGGLLLFGLLFLGLFLGLSYEVLCEYFDFLRDRPTWK